MHVPTKVVAYFETRSRDYRKHSEGWPWRLMRRREAGALFDVLGPIEGCWVLDLGCGAGYYTREALSRGARSVVGVDLAPGMIRALPTERTLGLVANAADVELPDIPGGARFICAGLLEFVSDPRAVLKNLRRQCPPDGVLVVLVPYGCVWGVCYRLFHAAHGVPVTLFGPNKLVEIARSAGWEAVRSRIVRPSAMVTELRPV